MNITTAVGLALIASGIVWRVIAARRAIKIHATALRSADPIVRASAARTAVSCGLDRTARLLIDHVSHETEDIVLDAIANAVALRQWEPSDRPAVSQIREWSADRLIARGGAVRRFGPAVTRLADMGGPQREFKGNAGVTGDRTLDNTIAEIRALCARVGVEHAEFTVAGQRLTLELTPEGAETIPGDIATRLAGHDGAAGTLGGYDIKIVTQAPTALDTLASQIPLTTIDTE